MLRAVKYGNWKKFAPYLGGALGIGVFYSCFYIYKNARHPLVRYSRAVLEADPHIKEELGSKRIRSSLLVSSTYNSADKEYEFTYKLKGRNGYAEVVVIGDALLHKNLVKMNEDKAGFLQRPYTPEERMKVAMKSTEFVPINISRFFIPESNPFKNTSEPIPGKENMWRVKELIIETASSYRKLTPKDIFKDIVESEYTLKTYNDVQRKIQHGIRAINTQMESEVAEITPLKAGKPVSRFYYAFALALTIGGIAVLLQGRRPITNSAIFLVAMSKMKYSKKVQSRIGEVMGPLWTKGIMHKTLGFAHFQVHLFGSKGEGTAKILATRPLIGKNKKEWNIRKMIFAHNGEKIVL